MLKEPVRRPRVFFICVRRDAAVSSDQNVLVGLLSITMAAMIPARCAAKVHERISSSPASLDGQRSVGCTEKQAQVLKELQARLRGKTGSQCLAVDISQSRTHVRFGLGGSCPTFARSSKIVILDSNTGKSRFVTAVDGLLLHSYPVHEMRIPASLSEAALKQLVGNTQHVQAVAAAELLVMCLVNGSRPAATLLPTQHKVVGKCTFLALRWGNGAWIPRSVKKSQPASRRRLTSKRISAAVGSKRIGQRLVAQHILPHTSRGGSASATTKRKLTDIFKSA